MPLILEGFDDEYWAAFMSRRQQDQGPDAFLPWVLDGAPAPAVAEVTGALPPPVRTIAEAFLVAPAWAQRIVGRR